jgi:hypothetical protein
MTRLIPRRKRSRAYVGKLAILEKEYRQKYNCSQIQFYNALANQLIRADKIKKRGKGQKDPYYFRL